MDQPATHRKIALITGASAGFGHELAKLFARDRHDLILVARRADRLEEIAEELSRAHGIAVTPMPQDLAQPGAARELHARVQELGLEVEYLVNNAGFGTFGPFAETDPASTMNLLNLNMGALTELTALLLPSMVERGSGRIMNVASLAAYPPGPLMATYYASKAYVLHFSEALAEELEGKGVTVTALAPGPSPTEFQKAADMENSNLVRGRVLMPAETIAEAGYRGMMRGKMVVIPGLTTKLLALVMRLSPRRLLAKFVYRLNEDPERHAR